MRPIVAALPGHCCWLLLTSLWFLDDFFKSGAGFQSTSTHRDADVKLCPEALSSLACCPRRHWGNPSKTSRRGRGVLAAAEGRPNLPALAAAPALQPRDGCRSVSRPRHAGLRELRHVSLAWRDCARELIHNARRHLRILRST